MIKNIIFDCDGLLIKREKRFSQRLFEDMEVKVDSKNKKSFFNTDFLRCEIGKEDLKQVLSKWIKIWKLSLSVKQLMDYWFSGEAKTDVKVLKYVQSLKRRGFGCYMATNNEKYRVWYLLKTVGLEKYFDDCFASYKLGALKTKKIFWKKLLNLLGKKNKPNEILFWDDDWDNVKVAKSMGIFAEYYYDYKTFRKTMKKYGIN